MKKIDFTKIKIVASFDDEENGRTREINIARQIGNLMKFSGNILLDIGWEELAKTIYYSKGPVEVPQEYRQHLLQLVSDNVIFNAAAKRAIIELLK